jgi:hypothetical protein
MESKIDVPGLGVVTEVEYRELRVTRRGEPGPQFTRRRLAEIRCQDSSQQPCGSSQAPHQP